MKRQDVRDRLEKITLQEHYRMVRYVGKVCRCPEIAQDCVQEAYMLALLHANQIQEPERLSAWLMTVSLRMAKHQIKTSRRLVLVEEPVQIETMDEERLLNEMVIDSAIQSRIGQYPAYYTDVLWMHYAQRERFEEIARELHMPYGTVRNAHYRMKRILRRALHSVFNQKHDK